MTPDDTKVQYRLSGRLAEWLTSRMERAGVHDSPNAQARAELALWQATLDAELGRIQFTLNELRCIADVLADRRLLLSVSATVGAVYGRVYLAVRREQVDAGTTWVKRWNLDGHALLEKLIELGPAADHAVYDAVSRYLDARGTRYAPPTVEDFAKFGLAVTPILAGEATGG